MCRFHRVANTRSLECLSTIAAYAGSRRLAESGRANQIPEAASGQPYWKLGIDERTKGSEAGERAARHPASIHGMPAKKSLASGGGGGGDDGRPSRR